MEKPVAPTDDERVKIRALYKDGFGVATISRLTRVSRGQIEKLLHAEGIMRTREQGIKLAHSVGTTLRRPLQQEEKNPNDSN